MLIMYTCLQNSLYRYTKKIHIYTFRTIIILIHYGFEVQNKTGGKVGTAMLYIRWQMGQYYGYVKFEFNDLWLYIKKEFWVC